jgi:hypothetical protein
MTETLFGYTIEHDDGSLVITVRGEFAGSAVRQLRERIQGGGSPSVLALLSPLVPIGRLLSAPVEVRSDVEGGGQAPVIDDEALDQRITQSFAAFQQQMEQFRAALNELKGPGAPAGGA